MTSLGGLIFGGACFRNFTVYRQYRLTLVWKCNILNRYLTCLKGHCQGLFLQFNPFPGNLTNIINYFEFEITKPKKKGHDYDPVPTILNGKVSFKLAFPSGHLWNISRFSLKS